MPYVNGVYMAAPGAAVVLNDQNFTGQTNAGGIGMLLIGPATDGEPNTELDITSGAQATQLLKGGDLLQAVLLALQAAQNGAGPSKLAVIRPELATQATSQIDNSSSVEQIALTTTSYGTVANSSKWQVTAGTPGYNVTLATDFVGPGGQNYTQAVGTNLALSPISVYYNGTGSTPTYTVSDTQLVLTATTSDTGGTIAFTSTMTVQQLVNQINQLPGWVATVTDPNSADLVEALFDNVSTAATVSTSSTSPTSLTANVTAVVRWINSVGVYFTATRQASATDLATSSTWTYAAGGTTPTAANSDWQNAYTTAQGVVGINLISCVSSSYTVWAMNDTHCHYMASIGQPRRGYVGDTTGQSISTETAQAAVLNSNRTSIVWPEQKGTDYNGNPTTFAPYLVAAQIMGQRAATVPYDALTGRTVSSGGLGQSVSPTAVATGLNGGVMVLRYNQSGQVIVSQDRTTWLQSTPYDKVENSTGLVADIIVADLNNTLSQFIGKPVTNATVGGASAALVSRLNYWYKQGYLAAQPKTSDVSLSGSGNTITGTAQAAIDVPTDYAVLQLTPTAVQAA